MRAAKLPRGAHWLMVEVQGGQAGTTLELLRPGVAPLRRLVEWGYGYLTANDSRVHFGLGEYSGPVEVRASWPDGKSEVFRFDGVDRIVKIERAAIRD